MLVVTVDSVIAAEVIGIAGSDGSNPPFQRPGAAAVLAQRLVQAVAWPVAGEVEPDGRDAGEAGEPVRLHVVQFQSVVKQRSAEVGDRAAR
jgi:hypothetical protein